MTGEKILLRIYLQSADRSPHTPTHERIVKAARKERMAGATVLHGIEGMGYHGMIHSSPLSLVEHVPVIVEIVDEASRIVSFLTSPLAETMIGGMITLERATVIMHRPDGREEKSPLQLPCGAPTYVEIPKIQPGPSMTVNEKSILLRVFIGESDRYEKKPLHEQIIQVVRNLGLAGATVLRGSAGFGANSVVHKASLLDMSSDLPLVIEIVDSEEKINLLLPHLEKMVLEGMITMEQVTVLMYRHNPTP